MGRKSNINVAKLKDILVPKNEKEFKSNLRMYYFGFKESNELLVKSKDKGSYNIPYDKINSFSDIYRLTNSGFSGDGSSPQITPMIDISHLDKELFFLSGFSDKGSQKVMDQYMNAPVYNNLIPEERELFLDEGQPQWVTLDNQIWRYFYTRTLGNFSGYASNGSWN